MRSGDAKQALPLLRRAAQGLPDDGEVHYHLGLAWLQAGDPARAGRAFDRALELGVSATIARDIETRRGR